MSDKAIIAQDKTAIRFDDAGQHWIAMWYPPVDDPPDGKRHGSSAICFSPDKQIVLVSSDHGNTWGFPGGRPIGDEDWRTTLEREVNEEACVHLEHATLMGFVQGECVQGHEQGLVLVRALWSANVSLLPWNPRYETTDRRLVDANEVLDCAQYPPGARPIYQRWIDEARHIRE